MPTLDRISISEQLLRALAAEEQPWTAATCVIDDRPRKWWRLTWNDGAPWAGEYKDVTASVVVHGQVHDDLLLRSLNTAEKGEMS